MIRVGYVPYSQDLQHPADRRRIAAWASEKGSQLQIRSPLDSDVLVLSSASNFGYWIKRAKQPVILDLVDGYLGEEASFIRDFFRNVLRTIHGTSSLKWITYTNHLKRACRQSAAVIVASPEQRELILPYNTNVAIILDDHSELDFFNNTEESRINLSSTDLHKSHLFWEGFGYTIKHFQEIAKQLDSFLACNNVGMYIVTNVQFPKWGGFLGTVKTERMIRKLFPISYDAIHIIPWSIENLRKAASDSLVGLIPISSDDKFAQLKSENKLLSMWHLGLPVIYSPIPSYVRLSNEAGIESENGCNWTDLIEQRLLDQSLDDSKRILAEIYINKYHSRELLVFKWDLVLNTYAKRELHQN